MTNIAWFKELSKKDLNLVGGKAANLGEMYNAGIPVPPGFVVTVDAYKHFLEITGIADKIYGILEDLNVEDNETLQLASKKIQEIIVKAEIPRSIADEIKDNYDNLNVNEEVFRTAGKQALDIIKAGRELPFVAVRSSATAEDIETASFAGQMVTFLNIRGSKRLVEAVQKCWASLFTARAIYYRVKNNFPHEKVFIAVIIQKMIPSTKSGVIFSINPITNDENEIVIEAGWGLGEAVVSGSINPDQYIVDKKTLELKSKKINEQEWMYTLDPNLGYTVKKNVSQEKVNTQILNDSEIRRLAELTNKIEQHYKFPQDIEYAIEGSSIYIVQSRPVTTLKKPLGKKEEIEKAEAMITAAGAEVLVKGLGVSPGVGSGAVKIVYGVEDLGKVLKGDVLVTRMTGPDMVPTMQRASAIVTDEGGTTCIGEGAKILTNEGFMEIEEVYNQIKNKKKILKTLSLNSFNLKLEWKEIIDAQTRKANVFVNNIYLQSTNKKKNLIKITPDHKMLTLKNLSIIKKELKDIYNKNESLFTIDKIPLVEDKYSSLSTEFMYLCGAILSDGCIAYRNNNPIGIRFTQEQNPHKSDFINRVTESFNKEFGCYLKNYCINKFSKSLEFSSNKKLPAQKIHDFKEKIVDFMLHSNEDEIANFLAGYADGDGCFNKEKQWLELYIDSRKKNLIEGLIIAGMRLNIPVRFKGVKNNCAVLIFPNSKNLYKILQNCDRINKKSKNREEGLKLFNTKQLIGHLKDIDWKGWLYSYIKNNRLIDIEKVINYTRSPDLKIKLQKLKDSDLSMMRSELVKQQEKVQVYNLTIKADKELNHNYIVFSEKYTPLVVGNCHAAIVSREMGIPAIVGTETATQALNENEVVTVDAYAGKVYRGKIAVEKKEEAYELEQAALDTITGVKVVMDLPDFAEKAAQTGADGVGLLRNNLMLVKHREHPSYMVKSGRKEELINYIVEDVSKIAEAFKGKPVWYRTLDAPTDEYRGMKGGEDEPVEANPMMGWRSIRRSLDEPGLLLAEFEAIKRVHDSGLTNVGVMLPLVTHVEQISEAKKYLRQVGLEPMENIEFGIMVETPAAVQIIEEICKEGIDFISFGTNDLTQFTLALDRNSAKVSKLYDEKHPAVLRQIKYVIDVCRKYNVETSICGQAGSDPEMAELLVRMGIDSISANPDAVKKIRYFVAKAEKKLLLDVARRKVNL